ncbi:hypothetical protein OG762_03845 [Streptomyces sp. NBC_01136]|nr:hypothetical protein OG762_03845 [Streptomyces sp. NBC_01136]
MISLPADCEKHGGRKLVAFSGIADIADIDDITDISRTAAP